MSSEIAIRVRNLSKCYQIYERPHHRLMQSLFRRRKYFRDFWALRDVSLEVKRGEVLGIIGYYRVWDKFFHVLLGDSWPLRRLDAR